MGAFQDLTGLRFGRLVVIKVSRFSRGTGGNTKWLCRCDCKTRKSISSYSLKSGDTRSCGCLRRDVLRKLHTTHGQAGWRNGKRTPEYDAWQNMIGRCYDTKDTRYYRYGARGIKVCKAWRHSFEIFLADMGPRPHGKAKNGRSRYSIDRIDNDRGYSKANCRWATITQQARNRR